METECPYRLLGISPSATEEDIIKAHRKLMKTHHPDKTDDPAATETSKRLNAAKARALASLAALKDRRSQEFELEAHIFALYGAISHTANHPLPLSAEIHARIKALVAQCKGETSAKLGPNPEIDGHYWLMRKLEQRNADDRQYHQEQLDTANRRIADLQARLDAETAARERAENNAKGHEALYDTFKHDTEALFRSKELEFSKQIEELTTLLASERAQRTEAQQASSHHSAPTVEPTPVEPAPGGTKRKHRRITDPHHTLSQSLAAFIKARLTATPHSFVSAATIKTTFLLGYAGDTPSDKLIFQEIKRLIQEIFQGAGSSVQRRNEREVGPEP